VQSGLQNNLRTGSGGSCGFGPTGVTGYPDGAIASLNGNLTIISGAAEKGCGACIQLTCVDAVRLLCLLYIPHNAAEGQLDSQTHERMLIKHAPQGR